MHATTQSKGGFVLVIDEDDEVTRFASFALGRDGWGVKTARGRDGALSAAGQGGVDLVVLGDTGGRDDGVLACRDVRARAGDAYVPVLLLLAPARNERHAGTDAIADAWLCKPFDPCSLRARVRALMCLKRECDELLRSHEALRSAHRQLGHTSALLGGLDAALAERIRNPLTAVIVALGVLTRSLERRDDLAGDLEMARLGHAQATRMLGVVERYLDRRSRI